MANVTGICAFIMTLPLVFDSWNTTDTLDYYKDHLVGFDSLSPETRSWSAGYLTSSMLQLLGIPIGCGDEATSADVDGSWGATETRNTFISIRMALDTDYANQTEPPLIETPYNATEVPYNATEATYNATYFCNEAAVDEYQKTIVLIMLPVAVGVIIILMFLRRRQKLCLGCFGGRPYLVYPVDFVDEHGRVWAFAAVFALMAYRALMLFEGEYFWKPDEFDDPVWMKSYKWCRVFVGMLNVFMLGVAYYPLLACLSNRRLIAANVLGFLFVIPWAAFTVLSLFVCQLSNEDGNMDMVVILQLIFTIPMLFCYMALLVAYILDFVINVRRRCLKLPPKSQRKQHAYIYTQALWAQKPSQTTTSVIGRVKEKVTYEQVVGFKYSPRVICTTVVACLTLYKAATSIGINIDEVFGFYEAVIRVDGFFGLENISPTFFRDVLEGVVIVRYSLWVCNLVSALIHVAFLVLSVLKYRKDMIKLMKGQNPGNYVDLSSPASKMVASLRYPGYQVAFAIYGWLLLMLILWIVTMVFTFLVIIPLRNRDFSSFLIDQIISLWPTIIVSLVIWISQILLCKFVFLQNRGSYMALDNRHLFHVVSFFTFFFNVLVGLFACLKRVLTSLGLGLLIIARLDKVLLMEGFEQLDAGYRAYLGMLFVELNHNHPVMKTFALMLLECRQKNKGQTMTDAETGTDVYMTDVDILRRKRIRNKWRKLVTLMNNPVLVLERLTSDLTQRQKDHQMAYTNDMMNASMEFTNEALKTVQFVNDVKEKPTEAINGTGGPRKGAQEQGYDTTVI